jgi:calcineurin-like phosphoesterase family protein
MNETIITNWNNKVRSEDLVFHNGDFCFRNSPGGKRGEGTPHKSSYWESKLNGKIIFIKGNHDRNNSVKTIIDHIVIKYGPHYVNIVHNPEDYDDNFQINFVGHVHEKWLFKRVIVPFNMEYHSGNIDLINVGMDQWNFQPVTFEEIYNKYRKWKREEDKKIYE